MVGALIDCRRWDRCIGDQVGLVDSQQVAGAESPRLVCTRISNTLCPLLCSTSCSVWYECNSCGFQRRHSNSGMAEDLHGRWFCTGCAESSSTAVETNIHCCIDLFAGNHLHAYLQRILECSPELSIEVRINQRIDGRIEVANPEDDAHDRFGWRATVTQRGDTIPSERNSQQIRFYWSHIQRVRACSLTTGKTAASTEWRRSWWCPTFGPPSFRVASSWCRSDPAPDGCSDDARKCRWFADACPAAGRRLSSWVCVCVWYVWMVATIGYRAETNTPIADPITYTTENVRPVVSNV